jgi:hypothetical protein
MSKNLSRQTQTSRARTAAAALAIAIISITLSSSRLFDPARATNAAIPHDAPTPTPTPDELLEQARREAQIAEELKKKAQADKDRIEAENAKLKAQVQPLGAPSVSVPTGSVQTDAAGWVESQMLAHEAAKQISGRLKHSLCGRQLLHHRTTAETPAGSSIKTLVIYNHSDLAGVELYNTVTGQVVKLGEAFAEENKRAERLIVATAPTAPTPNPATDPNPANADLAALPLAAPGIATGVIKSVAELINLFRTDTTFANKSVQISDDMVVSHLVNFLNSDSSSRCAANIQVFYPELFPPKLTESSENSPLIKELVGVERVKNQAVNLVEQIDKRVELLTKLGGTVEDLNKKNAAKEAKTGARTVAEEKLKRCNKPSVCKQLRREIAELTKAIDDLNKAIMEIENGLTQAVGDKVQLVKFNAKNNFKNWLAQLPDEKVRLQSLINSTNLLSAKLNTPEESGKLTAMAQLLRAEKLSSILTKDDAYTLRVAVTANGTTKIKKNMFVDAKVRHSAGANLVYQLFRKDGAVVQGDVMQCYIDYRSAQDVRNIVSGAATVECATANAASNGSGKN